MPFQPGNPYGGRPKGARNKRSVELEAEARATGITPLQVMLGTVEHLLRRARTAREPERTELMVQASDIAAKIAPYLHPRLQAIQHTGAGGGPIRTETHEIPDAVADRLLATLGLDIRVGDSEETRH